METSMASRASGPDRTLNEIRGNDFSQSRPEDVDCRGGIDLGKQKLPAGDDCLFVADTCQASVIVSVAVPDVSSL